VRHSVSIEPRPFSEAELERRIEEMMELRRALVSISFTVIWCVVGAEGNVIGGGPDPSPFGNEVWECEEGSSESESEEEGRRYVYTWPDERPTVRRGDVGCRARVNRSEGRGRVQIVSNIFCSRREGWRGRFGVNYTCSRIVGDKE
jgi:hypothetical protein